jgi:ComF family protein
MIEPQMTQEKVPGNSFSIVTSAQYEGEFRRLIHDAKFKASPVSISLLKKVGLTLIQSIPDSSFDLITSVPADPKRLKSRGFDLPFYLAKAISKELRVPFQPKLILRTRPILSQQNLTRSERIANVKGAFKVKTPLEGRNILVVDDVVTTGATAKEITKSLIEQNPSKIVLCALAQTTI